MKIKSLYIGIASLLLCASCSKEEVSFSPELSDQTIEFGVPSIQVETKAGPVNTLPDGSSFGVFGYCLAQVAPDNPELNVSSGNLPWDQKKKLSRPHLFYNTPIQYRDGRCTYENPVKWYETADYLYTFFAYYPYAGFSVLTDENTLGAPKFKFSMPFESTSSDTELDPAQVPDAMIADEDKSCIDVIKAGGNVALDFRHILTGLNFSINNYNETEPVIVHAVKLSGTFFKSIEIIPGESTVYQNETYAGTYHLLKEEEEDITVEHHGTVPEVGGRTLLLVPSNAAGGYLGAEDLKVSITYSFGTTKNETKTFGRPENFRPEPGTVYSAQLNFIGNAFVLEFIVDDDYHWEDGAENGGSDITFE